MLGAERLRLLLNAVHWRLLLNAVGLELTTQRREKTLEFNIRSWTWLARILTLWVITKVLLKGVMIFCVCLFNQIKKTEVTKGRVAYW